MKRFLLTIWAGITAFRTLFTALFTSISVLWRGRTIRPEPEPKSEKTTGNVGNVVVEPEVGKSWLSGVRRMTLLAIDGVHRLDLLLRGPLANCLFQDLCVFVFLRGERFGIEYVVRDGGAEFIPPLSCHLSLEPRSRWDRVRSEKKVELDEGAFVSNAVRIELAQGDEKQAFVRSEAGFFLPAANRAA